MTQPVTTDMVRDALSALILDSAHQGWRDGTMQQLLRGILDAAEEARAKLGIERNVPRPPASDRIGFLAACNGLEATRVE